MIKTLSILNFHFNIIKNIYSKQVLLACAEILNASTDFGRNILAFLLYVYIDSLKEDFLEYVISRNRKYDPSKK